MAERPGWIPKPCSLLKISPGDLVAIEGKRRTVAKVWRCACRGLEPAQDTDRQFYPAQCRCQHRGYRQSRRRSPTRSKQNGSCSRPPEDLPKKIPIANNPHVVNGLLDFPVVKNDSIPIMLGLPFVQPQIVAFKVVEIEPEEAVIITKNTSVEFSDKPARDSRV